MQPVGPILRLYPIENYIELLRPLTVNIRFEPVMLASGYHTESKNLLDTDVGGTPARHQPGDYQSGSRYSAPLAPVMLGPLGAI